MTLGRPTSYTEAIAEEICERLINGESLNRICFDEHIPTKKTIYNWLDDTKRSDFLHKYIHARELQAETFIDQCVDIADDNSNDEIELVDKDGNPYTKINHDHINRSRLRVDTRIKIAEKLAPRKYTPKNEISGPDQKPIKIQTNTEVCRRLAFMLRKKEEENKQ